MSDQFTQVDVNTADRAELSALPGIKPAVVDGILAKRPFDTMDDLRRVSGIGRATLDKWAPYLIVADAETTDGPEDSTNGDTGAKSETLETQVFDTSTFGSEGTNLEMPAHEPEELTQEAVEPEASTSETPAPEPAAELSALEEQEVIALPEPGETSAVNAEADSEPAETIELPRGAVAYPIADEIEEEPFTVEDVHEEGALAAAAFTADLQSEIDDTHETIAAETEPYTAEALETPYAAPAEFEDRREEDHREYVSRRAAWGIALGSALASFLLAVAVGLGVLLLVNGGLEYVSPGQFSGVQRQVQGLTTQADILEQDINGLRTRMTNLEGLTGRMDTVEQNAEALRTDIDSAATRVEGLAGDVDGLASDVDDLNIRSTRFQTFLDGLRDLLGGLSE